MAKQPLVSIIVPVYRVAQYLPKCLDSILEQTYQNWEMILVDDGSPDECPGICDAYGAKDARIRVLHQENQGLSGARNAGTALAIGAFVLFVDSDDWILPQTVQTLVDMQRESGADIVACGMQHVFPDVADAAPLPEQPPLRYDVLDGRTALAQMCYQTLLLNSAWGKLIPLEVARQYPFPLGRLNEDLATTYRWLFAAKKVAITKQPLYRYLQRSSSIMAQPFTERSLDLLLAANEQLDFVMQNCPEIANAARARRFSACCQILLKLPKGQHQSERAMLINTMKQDASIVLRDWNCRKKDRGAALLFLLLGANGLRFFWNAMQGV